MLKIKSLFIVLLIAMIGILGCQLDNGDQELTKKIDTETKTRKELESIITEGEILIEILKTLGFQSILA